MVPFLGYQAKLIGFHSAPAQCLLFIVVSETLTRKPVHPRLDLPLPRVVRPVQDFVTT